MRAFLIKTHQGTKRNYYTVHLIEDGRSWRIYGKFSKKYGKRSATEKAEKLSKEYGYPVQYA